MKTTFSMRILTTKISDFSLTIKNYRLRRRFASSWVASQTCLGFPREKGNLFDFGKGGNLFDLMFRWAPFFIFFCTERIFSTLILMIWNMRRTWANETRWATMGLPCEAKGAPNELLCLDSEIALRLSGETVSTKLYWKLSSFDIDLEIWWFSPLELNRPKNELKLKSNTFGLINES